MAQETSRPGHPPQGPHEQRKHEGAGQQAGRFECKSCRRSFPSQHELRQHEESEHRGHGKN